MVNLATNITIVNAVPRITKWNVVRVKDNDESPTPQLVIYVNLYGPGDVLWLGQTYCLFVSDPPGNSVYLTINPTPARMTDQFVTTVGQLTGTPYTTLAGLYNGNNAGGDKAGRKKTVEDGLIAAGVLPAAFSP
jgi:hypothetical protein